METTDSRSVSKRSSFPAHDNKSLRISKSSSLSKADRPEGAAGEEEPSMKVHLMIYLKCGSGYPARAQGEYEILELLIAFTLGY